MKNEFCLLQLVSVPDDIAFESRYDIDVNMFLGKTAVAHILKGEMFGSNECFWHYGSIFSVPKAAKVCDILKNKFGILAEMIYILPNV